MHRPPASRITGLKCRERLGYSQVKKTKGPREAEQTRTCMGTGYWERTHQKKKQRHSCSNTHVKKMYRWLGLSWNLAWQQVKKKLVPGRQVRKMSRWLGTTGHLTWLRMKKMKQGAVSRVLDQT